MCQLTGSEGLDTAEKRGNGHSSSSLIVSRPQIDLVTKTCIRALQYDLVDALIDFPLEVRLPNYNQTWRHCNIQISEARYRAGAFGDDGLQIPKS